jgi:hypothetical protein
MIYIYLVITFYGFEKYSVNVASQNYIFVALTIAED